MEIVKTTMLIVLKWGALCTQPPCPPVRIPWNPPKNSKTWWPNMNIPRCSQFTYLKFQDFFSGSTFYNSLRRSKFARIELKDLYKSRCLAKALLRWAMTIMASRQLTPRPNVPPLRKWGFNSWPYYWGKPMMKQTRNKAVYILRGSPICLAHPIDG